ncbi:hypothetical protein LOCC1_G002762 [Lachnellula occidentalis]|uniref:Uncharacterized protein n=1 Tax=Lachnellula occidentalis TaxID=215460 RepID=A0A8H8UIY8_9HELO|nr:hypothetical protein LOCC1_G002762 [Lachnellula occidentalis]
MATSTTKHVVLGASYGLAIAALLKYLKDGDNASTNLTAHETEAQLGPWYSTPGNWMPFEKQTVTLGPAIDARLADGFCGVNEVQISRLPHAEAGTSCWSILTSIIHPTPFSRDALESSSRSKDTIALNPKKYWAHLALEPLTLHDGRLCIKISRATLMTLFALTNARPVFSYSSAAGYRSAYPSYCGQWSIAWPIGKPCMVSLAAHDSHSAASDVYPPDFSVRIDKCVEMLAGIVSDGAGWKLAFPGRAKGPGPWRMQEIKKGFPGAHGSRHLYNMMGGKVYEVDLLALVRCESDAQESALKLEVPCLAGENDLAVVFVPEFVQALLAHALDCLPWSSISWSMHRGLKDVLLAYGKPVMDRHRNRLAAILKCVAKERESALVEKGWDAEFVQSSMGDMAESSIMAGAGNSGDLVRIVIALVEVLLEHSQAGRSKNKDQTNFWREQKTQCGDTNGDMDEIIGLVKFFVLGWSQELDYQLYHQLPVTLFLT